MLLAKIGDWRTCVPVTTKCISDGFNCCVGPLDQYTKKSTCRPTEQCQSVGAFTKVEYGIGSWFRASHVNDDTNGNSWCGFPYKDSTNGFAPSLGRMTDWTNAKWGNDKWQYYGEKYCGLEAKVTDTDTGAVKTMYIVDAFDDKWVKTPGSIDIMLQSYQELTGDYTQNKMKVANVKWELTGNKNERYKFKGKGD